MSKEIITEQIEVTVRVQIKYDVDRDLAIRVANEVLNERRIWAGKVKDGGYYTIETGIKMNSSGLRGASKEAAKETAAIRDALAKPVAWMFELANTYDRATGEYGGWGEVQLSFIKPSVTPGSIRNLTPLYEVSRETIEKFETQVIQEIDEYIG